MRGLEDQAFEFGDFVLVPAAYDFVTSRLAPSPVEIEPEIVEMSPGVFRLGGLIDPPDVRMLVGHCAFGSDDASLLVSLLPQLVHVRQGIIDHHTDHPQGVIGGYEVIEVAHGEQVLISIQK